ncbi:MAG: tetratricopeptide repeat protein [Planctomycetota bacterium]|jgi:tetratricopeptide (TPR) repeat protein
MSLSQSHQATLTWETDREQQFVATAVRHLAHRDESGLTAELQRNWSLKQLVAFLECDDDNTVKLAAACLSVMGTFAHCRALAGALQHDDAVVAAVAEHALWRIWFRAGPDDACRDTKRAACLIARQRYQEAIDLLNEVTADAPDLAEAYNQRAIAYYLSDRHLEAIADFRRTVRLNPTHFAALAGMGHCFLHLGQYQRALEAYRAALDIHPRMDGLRQSIRQIRSVLNQHATASVEPTTA